jgi:hypothetical protein
MNSARSFSREIGTALAVLAVYLFTILAPLHEARASQLAFEELGFSTTQTGWVLCNSLETNGQDGDVSLTKCPVTGIGKPAAVAPTSTALVLEQRPARLTALRPFATQTPTPAIIAAPSGPRGPPALV